MSEHERRLYIVYHFPCFDGFGAAFAGWLKYGDKAKYIGRNYGDKMPEMRDGSDVVMIDVSWPKAELLALKDRMNSLLILDHHKTAQDDLKDLEFAKFDMTKSGAVMAVEHFFPDEPVAPFFLYLQDRDLWKFEMKDSRAFSAGLRCYPMDFEQWRYLEVGYRDMIEEGRIVLRVEKQMIDGMLTRAYVKEIGGYTIHVANATTLFSEVAEGLLRSYPDDPFIGIYFDLEDGNRKWSLRSGKDFDCSAVAKSLGGGGHPQASGFLERRP